MEYGFTRDYLTRNGTPWLPVMGEFHYSRYPAKGWRLALEKMKAGGVQIVSTYAFWIHHEEAEGEYDFSGCRNLRGFVQQCAAAGLPLFLRIGPWCHGEVRNGGFPDWLCEKDIALRTNDPAYLAYVAGYYKKLHEQVQGLLHKDGGPIIGVQIENEYGHAGGLTGQAAEQHMRTLTKLAKQTGFTVPYYTATGWGGAATGGLLPVMGGYCDAPWDRSTGELPPNENFVFSDERNDTGIASDTRAGQALTFDPARYPFLTAELGGGLQVTRHRRPVPTAKDIAAMSLCKLGSGANLLGYYMYHGGTNPVGRYSTLQESTATGYPNDVPELSYDFQAPIREYGQISDTYRELKLLALFLQDYGSGLCSKPSQAVPPRQLPADTHTLRTATRLREGSGYIFVNNHQRHRAMATHPHTQLTAAGYALPPVDIREGDFFLLPINQPLRYGVLQYATATPLCRLNAGTADEYFVFYPPRGEAQYQLTDTRDEAHILTIPRSDALHAWRVTLDRQYLLLYEGAVTQDDTGITLHGRQGTGFRLFPAPAFGFAGCSKQLTAEGWALFTPEQASRPVKCGVTVTPHGAAGEYTLEIQCDASAEEWLLTIDYAGDGARLYMDGRCIADDFYTGQGWQVGLARFGRPAQLALRIAPLGEGDAVYLEKRPAFENGVAQRLVAAALQPQYVFTLCPV